MSPGQLRSILEHPSISKGDLIALARAVGHTDQPQDQWSEALIDAILQAGPTKATPFLQILPPQALEGVDLTQPRSKRRRKKDGLRVTERLQAFSPEKRDAYVQTLRESVDKSSKVTRTLALTFVALMFYILLIVASTTDLMLFLPDSRVTLPILNIELDLLAFYTVTPFLIIILHFNLLINLYHHKKRLDELYEAEDYAPNYNHLHPFLFNYLERYAPGSFFRPFFKGLIQLALFWFPVFVVIALQYRFLAYHDYDRSLAQFIASVISIAMATVFLFLVLNRIQKEKKTLRQVVGGRILSGGMVLVFLGAAGICEYGSWVVKKGLWVSHRQIGNSGMKKNYLDVFPEFMPMAINLNDYVNQINQVDESLVAKYLGDSTTIEEARSLAILNHGKGLNLIGRDFKYAVMERINLSNVNAREADFSNSTLENADFSKANLKEARFSGAYMVEADFRETNLINVDFFNAVLSRVKFGDAILLGNNFMGSYYTDGDFSGFNLSEFNLSEGVFSRTSFRGADLSSTNFSGAMLIESDFRNASLSRSNLQSANLTRADLSYAKIYDVEVCRAIFTGVRLFGSYWKGIRSCPFIFNRVFLNPQSRISKNYLDYLDSPIAIVDGDTLTGQPLQTFLQSIAVD